MEALNELEDKITKVINMLNTYREEADQLRQEKKRLEQKLNDQEECHTLMMEENKQFEEEREEWKTKISHLINQLNLTTKEEEEEAKY